MVFYNLVNAFSMHHKGAETLTPFFSDLGRGYWCGIKETREHKQAELVICSIVTSVKMNYRLSHVFPFQICQFGLN